jgi:uncharacterized membrane protein AbrB (regulator of aidB expression)
MHKELTGFLGFNPGPLGEMTAMAAASTEELRGNVRIELR